LEKILNEGNNPIPESESQTWLTAVIEGGIPQIVAGPAGKAISRLIGASFNIPVAYLDGISQGIRDKTDARSALTRAIAECAKLQAVEDPSVMERALNSMLSRSYRGQLNKDNVAKVALEDLQEVAPNPDSTGPSDDWMDKFERHAEEAGTVNLQFLFGKILAGEIRSPGTISLSTLHFVSMLDSDTASLINRVLPFTLPIGITLLDAMPKKLNVAEVSFIEQSGFFSADKQYNPTTDEEGKIGADLGNGDFAILIGNKNTKVGLGDVGILSPAGKGLLKALQPKFESRSCCDLALKSNHVKTVLYGKGVQKQGGFEIGNPVTIENQNYVEE
jgi:hypothetical protein